MTTPQDRIRRNIVICQPHGRAASWCQFCRPGLASTHEPRAAMIRDALREHPEGLNRRQLAEETGLTVHLGDSAARWGRENNYFAPFSLLSTAGPGGRYWLSDDDEERGINASSKASGAGSTLQMAWIGSILPIVERAGLTVPERNHVDRTYEMLRSSLELLVDRALSGFPAAEVQVVVPVALIEKLSGPGVPERVPLAASAR